MRYISRLPEFLKGRWPRRLSVLGSTGSIGGSALDVARRHKNLFSVTALAGARNLALLAEQAAEFRPPWLGVLEGASIKELRRLLPAGYAPCIVAGPEGYAELAVLDEADVVLSAQVGAAGLHATAAAAAAGKVIALANKESLVLAGHIIRRLCAKSGACILPVDSEHNALFQCLAGGGAPGALPEDGPLPGESGPARGDAPYAAAGGRSGVRRLILTASGGPFRGRKTEELAGMRPEDALAHPNWNMGAKISIDSATLMNKGLEVIEACHLYGMALDDIEVLVHRESIVHSLAEFDDGSQLAQLGPPDMRIAIAYCLAWPRRVDPGAGRLDLAALGELHFERPDTAAFPCLDLAREAQRRGRGCPAALNAANEVAVAAFLERRIGFADISRLVEDSLAGHAAKAYSDEDAGSLEGILAIDAAARARAESRI